MAVIDAAIKPIITEEMNISLTKDPSAEEIKEAMFVIYLDKAPGPYGFLVYFFQSNWDVVGPDVISEVRAFFQSECMLKSVNETHIRLISKIIGPKKVADYGPKALCNVYYKVISRLMSRRMQHILEGII